MSKFEAKSLFREPNRVVDYSTGKAQQGYYVVPNMTREAISAILHTALEHENRSSVTCAKSVSSLLSDAGFT
jgi:hypothetical protein